MESPQEDQSELADAFTAGVLVTPRLGQMIRGLRERHAYPLEVVAAHLGVDAETLAELEDPKRALRVPHALMVGLRDFLEAHRESMLGAAVVSTVEPFELGGPEDPTAEDVLLLPEVSAALLAHPEAAATIGRRLDVGKGTANRLAWGKKRRVKPEVAARICLLLEKSPGEVVIRPAVEQVQALLPSSSIQPGVGIFNVELTGGLATSLRKLRVQAGLSLEELAEKVGISEEILRAAEAREGSRIHHVTLQRLAEVFQPAPGTLLAQALEWLPDTVLPVHPDFQENQSERLRLGRQVDEWVAELGLAKHVLALKLGVSRTGASVRFAVSASGVTREVAGRLATLLGRGLDEMLPERGPARTSLSTTEIPLAAARSLRMLREAAGLSFQDLEKKAGCAPGVVAAIENRAIQTVDRELLQRLATAVDARSDTILGQHAFGSTWSRDTDLFLGYPGESLPFATGAWERLLKKASSFHGTLEQPGLGSETMKALVERSRLTVTREEALALASLLEMPPLEVVALQGRMSSPQPRKEPVPLESERGFSTVDVDVAVEQTIRADFLRRVAQPDLTLAAFREICLQSRWRHLAEESSLKLLFAVLEDHQLASEILGDG